jgi:hypothetical protein
MKFQSTLGLVLFYAVAVQAQKYDFVPADFSIHTTTQFLWTDAPLTWLTGIEVVGITNGSEYVILPRLSLCLIRIWMILTKLLNSGGCSMLE